MMTKTESADLARAKEIFFGGNHTLVLVRGTSELCSSQRGVAPLVGLVGGDTAGYSAADKIVGKAAALLYVLLGVKSVYAEVLSKSAADVFARHGIAYEYGVLTDRIVNRRGDGPCPMEEAVEDTDEADLAYAAIVRRMQNL